MVATIISDEVAVRNIRNLKAERVKKGFNQQMLANILGVSTPTLSNVEAGKRDCPITLYIALAQVFGWENFVPCRKIQVLNTQEAQTLNIDFEQNDNSSSANNPTAISSKGLPGVKFTAYIDYEAWQKLKTHAAQINSSTSALVREAVNFFICSNSL